MGVRIEHRIINMVEHKYCGGCQDWVPITLFYKKTYSWDGLNSYCKKCQDYEKSRYNKKNKDYRITVMRKYYEQNKEIILSYNKEYRSSNKELCRNYANNYRAKMNANTLLPLTIEEWLFIMQLFDHQCIYCGDTSNLSQDHIVAISKGGPHSIGNVGPSCMKCNTSKNASDMIIWYKKQTFFESNRLAAILDYMVTFMAISSK